jgi:ABC-type spermidine/putrescine transport system permease subunit II
VVIVRARLASIGPEYEAAARDLGATPVQPCDTVLLPPVVPGHLRRRADRVRVLDGRLS